MTGMLKSVALAVLLATGFALKISESEGPIQKVLRVLNTLRGQVVDEGKKEAG